MMLMKVKDIIDLTVILVFFLYTAIYMARNEV